MRNILCWITLLGCGLWAQTPKDPMVVPPDTVIGIVDGEKVTAGELQFLASTSAPQLQETLKKSPMELLRYYGFMKRLASMAEAAKLDRESPQRERLRITRMQVMAEAQLGLGTEEMTVAPDEQKKHYEQNRLRYSSAKVRVIYLPFMENPPNLAGPGAKKVMNEAEAKAKAARIMKELGAGADFVRLVKQHSEHAESAAKDGDFGTIRGTDNYPVEVKKAVLGAKTGALAGPLRLGNGYYIFRVDESTQAPYEQVKDEIFSELRDERWRKWLDKVRSEVEIKLP